MDIIKRYNGQQEDVWQSAKGFLRNEPILAEAGEKRSGTLLSPVRVDFNMWIQCIHTGAMAEFLVALDNEIASRASAILLKGEEWDIMSIMKAATGSVRSLFPDASFRHQRSILMDIGRATYRTLGELNQISTWNDDSDHLGLIITIDPYQPLLDVEWIEDLMEKMAG